MLGINVFFLVSLKLGESFSTPAISKRYAQGDEEAVKKITITTNAFQESADHHAANITKLILKYRAIFTDVEKPSMDLC